MNELSTVLKVAVPNIDPEELNEMLHEMDLNNGGDIDYPGIESVCLSVCRSVGLSVCLSVFLSVCRYFCLSERLANEQENFGNYLLVCATDHISV